MSVDLPRTGHPIAIVERHIPGSDRVQPDRNQPVDPEKRSRFKQCCSKVCEVVKKIFYLIFCCFCCKRKKVPTQQDLALNEETKRRKANRLKQQGKPDVIVPAHTIASSNQKNEVTFESYGLKKASDPELIKLSQVGAKTLSALLLQSQYHKDIEEQLKTFGKMIQEFTQPKDIHDMAGKFSPAMTVLKKFFEEQLVKHDREIREFDLSSILGSNLFSRAETPKAITEAFEVLVLALFDSLEDKKELKQLNREDRLDKSKIAEFICDQVIFKKLEDPNFAKRRGISKEKFDTFIQHKAIIKEIIVQFTLGMPLQQLDKFNTKEFLYIIYDLFMFAEAFMKSAAANNNAGQTNICEVIGNLGKNLTENLPNILKDLIEKNIDKLTAHFSDRVASIFGQGEDLGARVYPDHRRKVDEILGNKGLKLSLDAVVHAEDKRIGYVERGKETLPKEELMEAAEAEFIGEFVTHKGCHTRIAERVNASDLPLQDVVAELQTTAVGILSDLLCKQILQPIKIVDPTTNKMVEQVPWLRVLWNSLEKPKALNDLLAGIENCIDTVIKEQNVQFKGCVGAEGLQQFKDHAKNVIQYLAVHFLTAKIEDFIKNKIMHKLFGLMSDRNMLFRLMFDSLFQARIGEVLEQISKDQAIVNSFNILVSAEDDAKRQNIRLAIAKQINKALIDNKGKLTLADMQEEGIENLENTKRRDGKFIELALPEIQALEEFLKNNTYPDISQGIKAYFNQPLSEDRKKIAHLNENLAEMVDTVVFQIGKLETPFSKLGMKICKKYILELIAKFLVPLRDSPYFLPNLYAKTLVDKTKLDGVALHGYINQEKEAAVTQEVERRRYEHFSKLLYDIIRAKSGWVGILNSGKTIAQMQAATERIFTALYDHPIVNLSSSGKALRTYSNINLFD